MDCIEHALSDNCVRVGHRYALLQRADKICHTASMPKHVRSRWESFSHDEMTAVKEAPKVWCMFVIQHKAYHSQHLLFYSQIFSENKFCQVKNDCGRIVFQTLLHFDVKACIYIFLQKFIIYLVNYDDLWFCTYKNIIFRHLIISLTVVCAWTLINALLSSLNKINIYL